MKKLIVLLLALALASALTLSALAESGPAGDPPEGPSTVGTLSLLNMTEDEYVALVEARGHIGRLMMKEGYTLIPNREPPEGAPERPPEGEPGRPPEGEPKGPGTAGLTKVVFYDTLDALLMALNAGDINTIDIYQSVARYLCAANDNLQMSSKMDMDKERNTFAELVQQGINGNDFSFLMMEDNIALRDAFNAAIADMKADGTLARLVKEQIEDLIDGGEILPIALPKIDGAETVRVAVTGALPPMDYVAADGTPAGFNTAVLAEIGTRIGKNIEIVVVDSLGRAAALASGTVDAVFWTRTSSRAQKRAALTDEENKAKWAEFSAAMTEEESQLMNEVDARIDFKSYGAVDMPEGTIVTEPYFSDALVPVELAR